MKIEYIKQDNCLLTNLKINNETITEEEFLNRVLPLDKHFEEYMNNYILPEAIAFYLKESFFRGCLCDSPLYNHINSTIHMLSNYEKNIERLIPEIKDILLIKYNLKIINANPLKFKLYM